MTVGEKQSLRVLVACEFSGIVRDAFIANGHDAISCDILPTERPGPHIQGDVLDILGEGWDLMIAHPPCTYLCRHRSRWNKPEDKKYRNEAKSFFLKLLNAPIDNICVENPVPLKKSNLPKYSQIIQPWQFGHDYSKRTCLWLKNLPDLQPTEIVQITYHTTPNGHRYTKGWYFTPRNWRDRSRTFEGIAKAMADQWGGNPVSPTEASSRQGVGPAEKPDGLGSDKGKHCQSDKLPQDCCSPKEQATGRAVRDDKLDRVTYEKEGLT